MKVLYIEPYKAPIVKEIEPTLESYQKEVDGYIECVYPYEDPVALIVNEEGKISGMELNRGLRDENGDLYDIIAGQFLIVGITDDDFCGLSDELIERYAAKFANPEMFMRVGNEIMAIPYYPVD